MKPPIRILVATIAAVVLSACSALEEAQNERAREAYIAGDYQEALETWSRLADKGNARAQNNMGVLYSQGKGVERDDETALVWFRKSAQQGFVLAQANLGDSYFQGDVAPQDYERAAQWYALSARGGDDESQFYMGKILADGLGMSRDPARAYMWYSIAAMNGFEGADAARIEISAKMTRQELTLAETLLSECMTSGLDNC